MLYFILALLSPTAYAGELTCGVNQYYSSMRITWDEKEVVVRVNNPRGYKGMPQFEAPIAPENFKMMELQRNELVNLGSAFTYRWPREKCEFSSADSWLFACRGAETGDQPTNDVRALSFTTARIDEKSVSGENKTLRLRFIFDRNKGGMYFAALPFPVKLCLKKD